MVKASDWVKASKSGFMREGGGKRMEGSGKRKEGHGERVEESRKGKLGGEEAHASESKD